MTTLTLDVRLDGFADPIGILTRGQNDGLEFHYRATYVSQGDALPLSLSLPLTDRPYGDVLTRAFFDNLLQERDGPLQRIMAREGIARDDVAGLLFHLGKDCAGAISVLPENAPPAKIPGTYTEDYEVLADEAISKIVDSLHNQNVFPDGTEDPSPLAGVQNKFALTLLPDGRYAWPKPGLGAPTTHIIKVPKRTNPAEAKLEYAALNLSKLTGQYTIDAEVRNFEGIDVLIVKRFDRALNDTGQIIRIHQEDFAQALGLPRELKYERDGKEGRRFDAETIRKVIDETASPAESRRRFVSALVFDLIVGNVDAHAKNHAILYNGSRRPSLAPRYDLVPTRLNHDLTDQLPFKIGGAGYLEEISAAEFDEFLKIIGIATQSGRKRIAKDLFSSCANSLAPLLDIIANDGMKNFADLIASNMRRLLPLFEIELPDAAKNRDAFISRGGGWLSS